MTDEEAESLAWETAMLAQIERHKSEIERLTTENDKLRNYALRAFTVVEFCCGEGFLLEPPFYDCDDLLMEGCNLFEIEDAFDARELLEGQK